jgi:hypothetical protein
MPEWLLAAAPVVAVANFLIYSQQLLTLIN